MHATFTQGGRKRERTRGVEMLPWDKHVAPSRVRMRVLAPPTCDVIQCSRQPPMVRGPDNPPLGSKSQACAAGAGPARLHGQVSLWGDGEDLLRSRTW